MKNPGENKAPTPCGGRTAKKVRKVQKKKKKWRKRGVIPRSTPSLL